MVKATLPEPQLEVELMASSHDSLREFREVGGSSLATHSPTEEATPVSLPEQPQINGGKERKGNLNVSHFYLIENAGLPKQVYRQSDLYGNGVTIVPNVHAVMAWAARKTLVDNEA
jgi:hypothetical protein